MSLKERVRDWLGVTQRETMSRPHQGGGRLFSLWYLFWRKPFVWLHYWLYARDTHQTMQAVILQAIEREVGRSR